jgi:heme/copper-type cytochrome/quinol oxidase subunit 2
VTAQRVAGWVAASAGVLLLVGIAASVIGGAAGLTLTSPTGYWPMGPGMMGNGPVGPGMMGFGNAGPGMMGFGNAGPAASAIPGATEVRVQAANFSFTPNEIRLPKGADVNLTLSNPSGNGVIHDFTVPALGIHVVANPGQTQTIGLRGLAAGRYDAFCSVPGHADLGMRATVIVE